MPKRLKTVISILTFALVISLSSCFLIKDEPISFASHTWLGYEMFFLAQKLGWLNSSKAKLVETNSATDSMAALLKGEVDAATLTLDEVLRVNDQGLPLKIILVIDVSSGADVILAKDYVNSLIELKGKSIAYETSAVGELMLQEALSTAALTQSDVNLIPIKYGDQTKLWNREDIDAVIAYEPLATELIQQGANRLFDSSEIPYHIIDVLAVRTDRLGPSHTDALHHLVSAYFKALKHFTKHPHDSAYRMAEHLGLAVHQVLPAYKGILMPNERNNYRLMMSNSELIASASDVATQMKANGAITTVPANFSQLFARDYLPLIDE